jgi:hypothetical protein
MRVVLILLTSAACATVEGREPSRNEGIANAAGRGIQAEAERILGRIQLTEYRHETAIDENKGEYYCDCSGFVGYVLNRTVARDDPAGPLGNKKRRPLAMDYEKAFEAAPEKVVGEARWQKIGRVADVRPGDVIAWRHEVPKPGNTGHVVIVDSSPVVEKDGLVRVVVIDSTTLSWTDDSGAKRGSGVGRRTMWFKVDETGRPTGYVRGARTAKAKMEAIAIGRAVAGKDMRPVARRAA